MTGQSRPCVTGLTHQSPGALQLRQAHLGLGNLDIDCGGHNYVLYATILYVGYFGTE